MSTTPDLFPETAPAAEPIVTEWTGQLQCKWGHPRVAVRLLAHWKAAGGEWQCGWFVQLDRAVDEWLPTNPDRHRVVAHYPWHRPAAMPSAATYGVACGCAARAAKLVLEQMRAYAEDTAAADEAREISNAIERQAQAWLTG